MRFSKESANVLLITARDNRRRIFAEVAASEASAGLDSLIVFLVFIGFGKHKHNNMNTGSPKGTIGTLTIVNLAMVTLTIVTLTIVILTIVTLTLVPLTANDQVVCAK